MLLNKYYIMNNKKLLVLIILAIFCVGMVIGTVSASHTFKSGKYKITLTDKQYKKLKKATNGDYYGVTKKTGKYKTYKVPKYKTKKVTKYKWKYKKVLTSEYWSWNGGSEWKDYNTWEKYTKKGWTWYGTEDKENNYNDGSYYSAHYYKLKKKVKVTEKKKVKVGYTTKKTPIKIEIGADMMQGAYISVFAEWYNDNGYHLKTYASKELHI